MHDTTHDKSIPGILSILWRVASYPLWAPFCRAIQAIDKHKINKIVAEAVRQGRRIDIKSARDITVKSDGCIIVICLSLGSSPMVWWSRHSASTTVSMALQNLTALMNESYLVDDAALNEFGVDMEDVLSGVAKPRVAVVLYDRGKIRRSFDGSIVPGDNFDA